MQLKQQQRNPIRRFWLGKNKFIAHYIPSNRWYFTTSVSTLCVLSIATFCLLYLSICVEFNRNRCFLLSFSLSLSFSCSHTCSYTLYTWFALALIWIYFKSRNNEKHIDHVGDMNRQRKSAHSNVYCHFHRWIRNKLAKQMNVAVELPII